MWAMELSERYRRRPGLPWREEPDAARDALAALAAGRDASGEGTLLVVERVRARRARQAYEASRQNSSSSPS